MAMGNLKFVYYGFGGFIGFVCGLIIQIIFMKLEDSKVLVLSAWVEQFGVLGGFFIHLVEATPYMGVLFGILLVHWLFAKQFEEPEPGGGPDKDD